MAADLNRRLVLASRPAGMVDHSVVRLESSDRPRPGPDEALVRVRYLSIDPTIRTWMNDAPGYLPPIELEATIRGAGIGEVIESRSARYSPGDLVFGMLGWQEYALVAGRGELAADTVPPGVDPALALNVFGVTGMTAYFGLLEVGAMKEGDTVVVSGAAGATGSTAGQIARLRGAKKVVGIAGSAAKCSWLTEELGFDAAIDYRAEDVGDRLSELCPDGIDLYFDNVGGKILDSCLGRLAMRGRVVLCGAISAYNATEVPPGPSSYVNLIPRRGRMEGFIILDYASRFAEAREAIAGWLLAGELRHAEHVVEGLEHAPEALNLLFTGGNTGKVLVRLVEP